MNQSMQRSTTNNTDSVSKIGLGKKREPGAQVIAPGLSVPRLKAGHLSPIHYHWPPTTLNTRGVFLCELQQKVACIQRITRLQTSLILSSMPSCCLMILLGRFLSLVFLCCSIDYVTQYCKQAT